MVRNFYNLRAEKEYEKYRFIIILIMGRYLTKGGICFLNFDKGAMPHIFRKCFLFAILKKLCLNGRSKNYNFINKFQKKSFCLFL